MKGDETYCVYIEKTHAIFLIFTLFIIIIISIISDSVVEASKFLLAAGIPVILILTMGCGQIEKHMRARRPIAHKKRQHFHKDDDTSDESSSEDEHVHDSKKYKGAINKRIDDEDRFIKHGSLGAYNSYTTADDYMTYRGPLRNNPQREKMGTINQRRSLRGYYEDDHDEHRDWWGNNDY
jgi:hypothetical protein